VLVLGPGGAARAAVFGLKERGAEVWILNRTSAKAQKLARQAKARTPSNAPISAKFASTSSLMRLQWAWGTRGIVR
jgi:shikimate 5-dehydrogenase